LKCQQIEFAWPTLCPRVCRPFRIKFWSAPPRKLLNEPSESLTRSPAKSTCSSGISNWIRSQPTRSQEKPKSGDSRLALSAVR